MGNDERFAIMKFGRVIGIVEFFLKCKGEAPPWESSTKPETEPRDSNIYWKLLFYHAYCQPSVTVLSLSICIPSKS